MTKADTRRWQEEMDNISYNKCLDTEIFLFRKKIEYTLKVTEIYLIAIFNYVATFQTDFLGEVKEFYTKKNIKMY